MTSSSAADDVTDDVSNVAVNPLISPTGVAKPVGLSLTNSFGTYVRTLAY